MFRKIKLAAYAVLNAVNISIVGQLKLNEVLVVAAAPFVFNTNDLKHYPYFRKIILSLLTLLFFQVVTDLFVVHNSADNFLRGWAAIIVPILSFMFLFKTIGDDASIVLLIAMVMVKNILYTDDISEGSEMGYFKFKVVPILTYALYLLCYFLYSRGYLKLTLAMLGGFSLLYFANDARSTGLTLFLAAVVIYLFNGRVNLSRQRIIVFTVLGLIVFQVFYMLYVNAILSNEIGGEHSSEQLRRVENPYNPLELLMTGRGETFVAITAIGDAPLFGHGSWAIDKGLKYYAILLTFHDEDMDLEKANAKDRLIPSHSILLGAWINCGIGGFVSILLLFYFLMKMGCYLIMHAQESPLYPVLVLMTIGLVWTFLFSPFQQLRFNIPVMGSIIMVAYYNLKESMEEEEEDEEEEEEPAPEAVTTTLTP